MPTATLATTASHSSRPFRQRRDKDLHRQHPDMPLIARGTADERVCRRRDSRPDCRTMVAGCKQTTTARAEPRSQRTTATFRQTCGLTRPSSVSMPSRCRTPKRGGTWTSTEPFATTDQTPIQTPLRLPHMPRPARCFRCQDRGHSMPKPGEACAAVVWQSPAASATALRIAPAFGTLLA
jgi:hypothetical protein